jgi:putative NIF3 family GTP cyclohydrolase 1 type 2
MIQFTKKQKIMAEWNSLPSDNDFGRRQFLSRLTKVAGSAMLLSSPMAGLAQRYDRVDPSWTVGEIMDLFMNEVPGGPIKDTVDTLKAGNRDIKVTGIVTTMFATLEVIKKAIDLNANFIIAHEPTFYNHLDKTDWLENDEVYRFKADLLKKHNMAIWRNHDHIHRHFPDGVKMGLITQLGWENYFDPKVNHRVVIPAITLKELIGHIKLKLGISTVRYIGELSQSCKKILVSPGFGDGSGIISWINKEKPDVVIGGEFHEWEVPEYIRDARATGQPVSLIIMGHADSEEPGSEYMATWLKEKVPGLKVAHIPAKNPLSFV